ncbi:MAG: toll/interleukin-1 receptor domain-containing protein [Ruminococcaceae bacterium]|nr:toll/interleukin-1 receptor domain-containing protein [Oscillospiraceae bacterium]
MTNQPEMLNESQPKQDFRFDVFISYRHSPLDSAAAAYLHKALENYKIPKEIQKKIGKKKINRVFRDEEELGASSDLFTEIENSIKASEYLVVILSPRYKQSKWCLKEIESFLQHRSRDNILAVIIEGEPYDVFPDILLEDGEPLALDLRAENEKEMLKLAKQRLPRLVAPVLGCTYDELYQRHRVYRMRRLAALSGIVAAVSLFFGAVTVKQNIEINKNFIAKQENQSRYLAQTSETLLEKGDREAALLVALEALPKGSADDSRPYVAEARIALENALYTYRMDYYYNLHPVKKMSMDTDGSYITDYDVDNDVLMTMDLNGCVYVWNAKDGTQLLKVGDCVAQEAKLASDSRLLIKTADSILCFDYTDGSLLWQWQYPVCEKCYSTKFDWAYNKATDTLVCVNTNFGWYEDAVFTPQLTYEYSYSVLDSHKIYNLDMSSGTATFWHPEDMYENIGKSVYDKWKTKDVAVSPDGRYVAIQLQQPEENSSENGINQVYVYPVSGGQAVYTYSVPAFWLLNHLYWRDNSRLVSVYSDDTSVIGMEMVENPFNWYVDCHDIATGEKLWTVAESSMSLNYNFSIQSFEANDNSGQTKQCIGITGGNVFVAIDRETGYVYSRMEDRSAIKLAQPLPNKTSIMMITQDGYVFVTHPLSDKVYNPVLNSASYYLDLGIISNICRYNDRTYIFNGSGIYWYQDNIDFNFKAMNISPSMVGFSENSTYMWFIDYNDVIHLYDVTTREELWTDDAVCTTVYDYNAQIVNNRYLVYPATGKAEISVYDIENATVADYPVSDIYNQETELFISAKQSDNLITAYTITDNYAPADDFGYNPEVAAKNILWVKDIVTGEDVVAFTAEDIIGALDNGDDLSEFFIISAMLSGDGNYLLIPCDTVSVDSEGKALPATAQMPVWDMVNNCWVKLPQEAAAVLPTSSSYYRQDGWIMPYSSLINMYGSDGSIKIVDLASMEILHSLDFGVVGSTEISFTPDGDHIIMQDGGYHLKVYNWREGRYTMEKTTAEFSSLGFDFYGDNLMSAKLTVSAFISNNVQVYDMTQPGVYKLQNTISPCIACDGVTTVIADNEYSRFYPYYSFDQLIEMAREILGDRQLTAAERQTYLID